MPSKFNLAGRILFALALTTCPILGQLHARETETRIVQSGHSLTDGIIAPLRDFIRFAGPRGAHVAKSTIPGSPLDWRWSHAAVPDIRQPEVISEFDVLVITERVPLAETMSYHESGKWAAHWCAHAWKHGAQGKGARCILYASWVSPFETDASFVSRLSDEQAMWEEIHTHLNTERASDAPVVPIIPSPQILAEAVEQIELGLAPGIVDISELFLDEIHLNTMGNYLIALAHYAVIFDTDPRGLPHGVPAMGGPNREQAVWMQGLVWDVLEREGN